jgi:hypothetical protein
MRIIIDTAEKSLVAADGRRLDLYGKEAFGLISELWLKTSWISKILLHIHLARPPHHQHPEDLIRLGNHLHIASRCDHRNGRRSRRLADLLRLAVQRDGQQGPCCGPTLRSPENRLAIQAHELASYIALVER